MEACKVFVDNAEIRVKAGNGGNGAVSFRREKYVPAGGPDGGDGGKGGDVAFVVDPNLHTLASFRYRRKFLAGDGGAGGPSCRSGKAGADVEVRVPPGTVVRDGGTGRVIADMTEVGRREVVAEGGRGGAGNRRFATPTRQAPNFAKPGSEGPGLSLELELRVIADVGLVGYPNVGKSTILSAVSGARPKIADYHFTTLEPHLGVVYTDGEGSLVMADIPGLIEGASEGVGLGHEFLRHIQRTKAILHVVDVSGSEGRDPVEDFRAINAELGGYSPALAAKPQMVAANKADLPGCGDNADRLRAEADGLGYGFCVISAATGRGMAEMVRELAAFVKDMPDPGPAVEVAGRVYEAAKEEPYAITVEEGVYVVEGKWLKRLYDSTNMGDQGSFAHFQKKLAQGGVIKALEERGIQEGDTVRIYAMEFDYVP